MSTAETGYFLVADVLGFSATISNTPHEQIEPRIAQWVSVVEKAAADSGVERRSLFSDTVFASAPSSENGLKSLISFARDLLTRGLEDSFLVRGGIAHGTFTWGSLTYGQAVIEAYKLEADQNWIGVACQGNLPHVAKLWGYDELVVYAVPRKKSPVQTQPVVSWPIPTTERLFELFHKSNSIRDGEFVSWEVGEKLDRTIQFRTYLHLLKRTQADAAKFHGGLPSHFLDNAVSKLLP